MKSGDETEKELWKRYDWEFHLALIRACNSKNMLELHAVLFWKYLRYQMLVLTYRGDEAARNTRIFSMLPWHATAKPPRVVWKSISPTGWSTRSMRCEPRQAC